MSEGRVVVVEDDATYRQTLVQLLTDARYDVTAAPDGLEGLAMIKELRPDVALIDWMMPRMDGTSLTRYLKSDEELKNIYLILVTARGETDSRVEGLDIGADDYLVKPVETKELLARVRSGLRIRALQHQLEEKNRQLEYLARTDPLTDLPNRRVFYEELAQGLANARRHGHHLSLAVGDVDRFKQINDRLGHYGGDAVLRAVAERLRSVCREGDIVCRIGGEEFAIIVPFSDLEGAGALAERGRGAVAESPIAFADESLAVTISLGVATASPKARLDVDTLFKLADEALYRAKNGGRNRVERATSP